MTDSENVASTLLLAPSFFVATLTSMTDHR
jgi:hypothetical protein